MLTRPEPFLCDNFVERDTEPLRDLVAHVVALPGVRRPLLRVPRSVLVGIAPDDFAV